MNISWQSLPVDEIGRGRRATDGTFHTCATAWCEGIVVGHRKIETRHRVAFYAECAECKDRNDRGGFRFPGNDPEGES